MTLIGTQLHFTHVCLLHSLYLSPLFPLQGRPPNCLKTHNTRLICKYDRSKPLNRASSDPAAKWLSVSSGKLAGNLSTLDVLSAWVPCRTGKMGSGQLPAALRDIGGSVRKERNLASECTTRLDPRFIAARGHLAHIGNIPRSEGASIGLARTLGVGFDRVRQSVLYRVAWVLWGDE